MTFCFEHQELGKEQMEKSITQSGGVETPEKHRGLREPWKPGESGNPAGRPKGSRNELSEEFVAEVYADWCEHGAVAIQTVRQTRPDVYVKVVALLSRQVQARGEWTDS